MFIVLLVGIATIQRLLASDNMTLTIYIIFQTVSPASFGPLSESVGQCLVYLLTLAIYALANLGMAFNKDNYGVVLFLRPLQSLGVSATSAISQGFVADICVPSERGRMKGWVNMTLNVGTCIGPVLGALVAYLSGDTAWIFLGIGNCRVAFSSSCGYALARGCPQPRRKWE
ncbi:major facilitator superfamily domain-containing protein [Aspergillus spectabilis]